jgi:Fe-S cluster assembly iron-binding protein IscA
LGLALDEPKEADEVFDRDGVKFVIDKGLLGETQPVTLDYISSDRGSGFQIKSALNDKSGCGSCSC